MKNKRLPVFAVAIGLLVVPTENSIRGRQVKHARYFWRLLAESHLTRRRIGADDPLGEKIVLGGTQMGLYSQLPEGQQVNSNRWKFRFTSSDPAAVLFRHGLDSFQEVLP